MKTDTQMSEKVKIELIKELRAAPIFVEEPRGITLKKLADRYQRELPYRVLAAIVNNKLEGLNAVIVQDCKIEFLDMRTQSANLIYQNSLSMMFIKAIYDVIGKADVQIENSINRGLYTEVRTFMASPGGDIVEKPITHDQIKAVEQRMREMVKMDIPFLKQKRSREETAAILMEKGDVEKMRILNASDVQEFAYYSLEDYTNFFYGKMVPSTGYIDLFELMPYNEDKAVLLRHPHHSSPNIIPAYKDDIKLSLAFGETKSWGRLMHCPFVTDLNEMIIDGSYEELILISEALHAKKITETAVRIKEEGKRIVLIAGPSSSGKTTFAKRLCIQLRVEGLEPLYLGTDDYFVERKDTPLDGNGEPDYESLSAIDVELFNRHMNNLLEGKEVDIPDFDFIHGHKIFGQRIIAIKPNQPIVIEGIHALNDAMTPAIDQNQKFKIYISPLTNLNIDAHNRIPTTDTRMLRRMVRDYQYRGRTAQHTIATWPKVRAGEDVNIFPYNSDADIFFNSVHIYELAVLKKYAEPLLESITREEPEYSEAHRMLDFLRFFGTVEDDNVIPNNSILREFIGGNIFVK